MNYSTYRFTLDIHKTKSQVSIPVLFQDTGIQFYINLTDGGKPYKIGEGCTAVFCGKKADGTALMNECDIIDGTRIVYTFTDQTTSALGVIDCEIRLFTEEGLSLTTPAFNVVVEARVLKDDEIVESETERTALTRIFESEQARVKAEEERIEAEQARAEAFKDLQYKLEGLDGWEHSCKVSRMKDYVGVTITHNGTYKGTLCFDLAVGTSQLGYSIFRINTSEPHTLSSDHSITRLSGFWGFPTPVWFENTEAGCTFYFHDITLSSDEVFVNDLGLIGEAKITGISAFETDSLPTSDYPDAHEIKSFNIVVDSAEWDRVRNGNSIAVVQETGDRTDAVMSQNAVTDELAKKFDVPKSQGKSADEAIIIKGNSTIEHRKVLYENASFGIPIRNREFNIMVGTPKDDSDATPKKYVEDHFPRFRHNVYFDICPDGDVNVSASIMFTYYSTSDAEIGHTITDFYNFIANDCDGVLACGGTLYANDISAFLFGVEANGNMIYFNASGTTAAIEVIDSDFYCEYSYEAVKQV